MLISDNVGLKTKSIIIDKEQYIMIKRLIREENITFKNLYSPSIGTHKHIKQVLTDIKGEINKNTIIVGDLYTSFTSMDRSDRKPIKEQWL